MRTYVTTDENGVVLTVLNKFGKQPVPEGWIEITERADRVRLRAAQHKYLVAPDGTLTERIPVRLVVGAKYMLADGKDQMPIEVKNSPEPMKVWVGREEITIQPGQIYMYSTTEPGAFLIKLADPKYMNTSQWGREILIQARSV